MNIQWRRSRTEKKIAGVAGGIAEANGWDPTLVRLGFILLALVHGIGLLLYVVLALIMPAADRVAGAQPAAAAGTFPVPASDRNRTLGYVLAGTGTVMLAGMLHLAAPMLAVLLVAGGWYLLRHRA